MKGICATPCTPSLMQTILLRYVWSCTSPSETAASLSQVIFVKQLLLSEFILGIIILTCPTTQSGQFEGRGEGRVGGLQNLENCLKT